MSFFDHEHLDAWRLAVDLVRAVAATRFPRGDSDLQDQTVRASRSVAISTDALDLTEVGDNGWFDNSAADASGKATVVTAAAGTVTAGPAFMRHSGTDGGASDGEGAADGGATDGAPLTGAPLTGASLTGAPLMGAPPTQAAAPTTVRSARVAAPARPSA